MALDQAHKGITLPPKTLISLSREERGVSRTEKTASRTGAATTTESGVLVKVVADATTDHSLGVAAEESLDVVVDLRPETTYLEVAGDQLSNGKGTAATGGEASSGKGSAADSIDELEDRRGRVHPGGRRPGRTSALFGVAWKPRGSGS